MYDSYRGERDHETVPYVAYIGSGCIPGARQSGPAAPGSCWGPCRYWHWAAGPSLRRSRTCSRRTTAARRVFRACGCGPRVLRLLWVPSLVLAASSRLAPLAPLVMLRSTAVHDCAERTCGRASLYDLP